MKFIKIFLIISMLMSIYCDTYLDKLKDYGENKISKVFYNYSTSDGKMAHASIFITLENVEDFSIRYHRIENSYNVAEVKDYLPTIKSGTTAHNPKDLTFQKAHEHFKSLMNFYQEPKENKRMKILNVINCYSFADLLADLLTDEKFNYTKIYLEKNHYDTESNTISKSKRRRSRKLK